MCSALSGCKEGIACGLQAVYVAIQVVHYHLIE